MSQELLSIQDLRTYFYTYQGTVHAVNGVDLIIRHDQTIGLVGETGSGKSVTALSIMRLIPSPPGRIETGKIFFEGTDLLQLDKRRIRDIRGSKIAMIFQDPMTSLNPVFKIGDQIAEGLMLHQGMTRHEAGEKVVELLRLCEIPEAKMRAASYPHELSGGMRQRAMIAMAIACNPKLLIADEPTTALDVTIQAQILDLMRNLKEEIGSSILLITHNLGVVAEMCDHVAVMYAGNIVEFSNVEELFKAPRHPYTSSLLRALPIPGQKRMLEVIPGTVPNLIYLPSGCEFHPRCKHCMEICKVEKPILKQVEKDQLVACHLYRD